MKRLFRSSGSRKKVANGRACRLILMKRSSYRIWIVRALGSRIDIQLEGPSFLSPAVAREYLRRVTSASFVATAASRRESVGRFSRHRTRGEIGNRAIHPHRCVHVAAVVAVVAFRGCGWN